MGDRKGPMTQIYPGSQINTGGFTPQDVGNFTRAANTDAYAANDVVAGASNTIIDFTKPSINNGYKVYLKLHTTDTGATGTFRFHFFNTDPATKTDNAALAISTAEGQGSYIGYLEGDIETVGGQKFVLIADARLPYFLNATNRTKNLWLLVQTITGFTPSSASVWTVQLVYENNLDSAYPTQS